MAAKTSAQVLATSAAARLSGARPLSASRAFPAAATRLLGTTSPASATLTSSSNERSEGVIDPIMERLWAFGRSVSISAAAAGQSSGGGVQQQQQQQQQQQREQDAARMEMYVDGVVRDPIMDKFFGPRA